ncbi:fibronectin type III domain-containing protein [Aliikangiella sp. IMCC44653]
MSKTLIKVVSTYFYTVLLGLFLAWVATPLHAATLSGVIQDKSGAPIQGASAMVFEVVNGSLVHVDSIQTVAADGAFSWELGQGDYVLRAYFNAQDVSLEGAPNSVLIQTQDFPLTENIQKDIIFDFYELRGKIVDSNGLPIANVSLETSKVWSGPEQGSLGKYSQSSISHVNQNILSDADGNFSALLFSSDQCVASGFYSDAQDCLYDITFKPSVGSGFANLAENNYAFVSDQTLNAELEIADQMPPQLVVAPYVKNIKDSSVVVQWITDEVTTGSVSISGLGSFSDSKQTTFHSVVVTGLNATTSYLAEVSSSDIQGNLAASANVSFTTAAEADVTPPKFIQQPSILEVRHDQFKVSFCADEAVNGKVVVDSNEHVLTELAVCHQLTIQNLNSNQTYSVAVSMLDGQGNAAPASPSKSVTTLAAADFRSPQITLKPAVFEITDTSAIVRWETDEAATSGVSYSDASVWRVMSNENLTKQHQSLLLGLSAQTDYSLRVASVDASGNGPTTSELIQFTTLATPDTRAPDFIGRPLVQDISHNSALISWRTNESSSVIARIGTQTNHLNRVEASPKFLTNQTLLITDLAPNTTYYYTLQAKDLAANATTSNILSFTTESEAPSDNFEITSGPIIEKVTASSISLSWKTNRNSDSRLVCESLNGISEVNKLDQLRQHRLTLTGLDFNTRYRCAIYSTDVNGAIASRQLGVVSNDETDVSPPQCSVQPNVTGYGDIAELFWEADEAAHALIKFREKNTSTWQQRLSDTLSTSGTYLLSGLVPQTDYQLIINLSDELGNSQDCNLVEFNSGGNSELPEPAFSVQPFVSDIKTTSAVVNWSTENNSNGQVRYGLAAEDLSSVAANRQLSASHQLRLNDLQPATRYYYQVDAYNLSGVAISSDTLSFTTANTPPQESTPAKIIAGPVVKNITDSSALVEWQTDKAADSQVSIVNGATFRSSVLTRTHSVILTGLTANTDYATWVTSTDEQSNTTQPKAANFKTLATADTTLPRFIAGPKVIAIDYDRLTVAFCADEPVTATLLINSVEHVLSNPSVCHQLSLTGLTPSTLYSISVSITDIAGNGPVTSQVIQAKTLADLDLDAPQINGPIVTEISDSSAIVSWTTNESSDSFVTYTDGNSVSQLRDSQLVLNHQMHLTGLSPNTTYTLSVASTDSLGNGPNVSAPVEFTTLGVADTLAPKIIAGPLVENITQTSAFIVWTTDEAASQLVKLGLNENDLNQRFSVSGLAQNHRVPLTGLTPDTLYYFQVESVDLAGNSVTSSTHSFTTLKPEIELDPLKITAGPDIVNVTDSSVSIGWQTNLNSNSRLVCETDQMAMPQLTAAFSAATLAPLFLADKESAIDGQYIVLFKNHASAEFLNQKSTLPSKARSESVRQLAAEVSKNVKGKVIHQFAHALNGFVLSLPAANLNSLRQDPRVLMVEQDQIVSINATQAGATWGLDRIDQTDLPLSGDYTYELDGTAVNAYVIDTGVLVSHNDFNGRALNGFDFVDNDTVANDCNGHGTHVAGTLGATTWGVAKNVAITAVKVLGCNGSGTNSGVIRGVDWVAANAQLPAVANMSLGGGNSPALDAAVNNAISAGISFVVAAGNSNINACSGSPNRVPAAITVASSTQSDSRSSFSNWGACVDLFAPGSNITSTWHNGSTNSISGTSMAAPHVAGAAALYLQAHPNATPAQVADGLTGFASQGKISGVNGSPNLLLNSSFDAETEIDPPPPPPPAEKLRFEISDDVMLQDHLLTLSGLQPSTIYQCTVYSADIDNQQVSAELRATTSDVPDVQAPVCEGETSATGFVNSAQISWASNELTTAVINYRATTSNEWLQSGSLIPSKANELLLTGLAAATEYEQQVSLTDLAGNTSECPVGQFNTIAPEQVQDTVFSIQPIVSNIGQNSATVSWQTLEPSSANLRYGRSPASLSNSHAETQFKVDHQVDLSGLNENTLYYLQVDAFNIEGSLTQSEVISFTTRHPDNDFDRDGVSNELDNCPLVPNPDQLDSDNDHLGDACDDFNDDVLESDFDKDGVLDDVDNCPINANPDQLDSDNDGIGDLCDSPAGSESDYDNDGILNDIDNCPAIPNPEQLDSDSDGLGDACDTPDIINPPPPPPELTGVNLSGIISSEGMPVDGALVAIYDSQQKQLAQVASKNAGTYLFKNVLAGNYYIGVTPPLNLGLSSPPLQPIRVDDKDVVHLISLIGDAIQLSGYLKDSQGRIIDNTHLSLHLQTTGTQVGNSVVTDSNGYFEFSVAPGKYKLKPLMDITNTPVPVYPIPDFAAVFHTSQNLTLTSDSQVDVVLPLAIVSGQTLDPSGNPLAGVGLTIRHLFESTQQSFYLENYADTSMSNAVSDESGNFSFAIFTDQAMDIMLTPPTSRTDLAVTRISQYSLSSDATESFSLVAGVGLSGRLLDSQGRAIDHAKVSLLTQENSNKVGQVYTDADGVFQFQVAEGRYKLQPELNPFGVSSELKSSYPLADFATVLFAQENILVAGNTTQDITLPMAILSGTVTDANGVPVANTRVVISHIAHRQVGDSKTSYYLENHGRSVVSHGLSDAAGQFSLALFTNQAMDISFIPATNNRQVAATKVSDYLITDDRTDTFILAESVTLSGYLRDAQGIAIDNSLITVHQQTNRQLADKPTLTDANGYFEFKVAPGSYRLRPYLQPANQVNGSALLTDYPVPDFAAVYYLPKNIQVATDTQVNVTLPMSLLSGKTLDINGVAVAGVKLQSDHAFADTSGSYYLENTGDSAASHAVSDPLGLFSFGLFANQTTDVLVNPPVGSGFAITNITHHLTQETSEDIFLPHYDVAIPKIINGPVIKWITDTTAVVEWQTDKPGTSVCELSDGQVVQSNELSTQHTAVLTGLVAQTFYVATVHSVDKEMRPSALASAGFTTLATVDNTPPQFISGPSISDITQDEFRINFCADEAVTGNILIDQSYLILDSLAVCHQVVVNQRTPNTQYNVTVDISDQQANGPTYSEPQPVTTLPLPDSEPPQILLLPFVIDISDTQASVIWTTDEAATSGVSYNDGVQYHVVSDSALVSEHEIQLTDLTPETSYTLTVSSSDARGNGPSLSQPISFTTLATPDTSAPIIVGSPLIQNITHQSVVIRWNTDEPATTLVTIGLSPQQMNRVESRNGALKTQHNIAITGLEPETVYYFQVQSKDLAGNIVRSEIGSFISKQRGHQGAPHFMQAVSVDQVTHHSVSVSWVTDVNAESRLVCVGAGETKQVSKAKRVKQHQLTLTGLSAGTSYQCTAFATDHKGFKATQVIEPNVQTLADNPVVNRVRDFIARLAGEQEQATSLAIPTTLSTPIISGYGNFATLALTSNELTAVQVSYRPVGANEWQHIGSQSVATNHYIPLFGLTENTQYELRYLLANIGGESAPSEMLHFNSETNENLLAPQFNLVPSVSVITKNTASLSWSSNDYSFAQVSYARDADALLEKEASFTATLDHQVVLVRLEPATIYYAQVRLFNFSGDYIDSDIVTFTTSSIDNISDSDADGLPDYWEVEHFLNPQDASDALNDQDNDGLSNREEFANLTDPNNSDSDADGMPDGWEVDHGHNPNDASDANEDADGDGISNLDEYLNASDKVAPVINLETQVIIDATGFLSAVPSHNITATDNVDGDVAVSLVSSRYLKSGFHIVDWQAQDQAGNKTLASQILIIKPLVSIPSTQITAEGNQVIVQVKLSGPAANYPVEIPLSISGSADVNDYSISQSAFIIESGTSGQVLLDILQDDLAEGDEQITLSLATPNNATLAANSQQKIHIVSGNVAPRVKISALQNGLPVSQVTWTDGPVTLSLAINDPNRLDEHTVTWNENDNAVLSIDPLTGELTFDPADVALGVYQKSVTVRDDGSPSLATTHSINLLVLASAPSLSDTQDSDADGVVDSLDGWQDSDGDGVPNYLDSEDANHLLQAQTSLDNGSETNAYNRFMLETEFGVSLVLGAVAQSEQTGGAALSATTLESHPIFGQYGADIYYTRVGGLFDFELHDIPQSGSKVQLVIPQQQAIPTDAVYRKLNFENGWQDYVLDENNQLYSAPGAPGICPSPGSANYQPGLNEGHWCAMLLIQDGGPNDSDGIANGSVVDPGGISQMIAPATLALTPVASLEEGGSFNLAGSVTENGNDIVAYLWQQTAGSSATISNANQLTASVNNAPRGTLTFSLTITDALGRSLTQSVSVVVIAKAVTPINLEPKSSGGGAMPLSLLCIYWLVIIGQRRKRRAKV